MLPSPLGEVSCTCSLPSVVSEAAAVSHCSNDSRHDCTHDLLAQAAGHEIKLVCGQRAVGEIFIPVFHDTSPRGGWPMEIGQFGLPFGEEVFVRRCLLVGAR